MAKDRPRITVVGSVSPIFRNIEIKPGISVRSEINKIFDDISRSAQNDLSINPLDRQSWIKKD